MRLQALLVSAVWIAFALWVGLPGYVLPFGVAFAFFLAWRDHRHDERDMFEYDEDAEFERARDGDLTWL
jgi:hypothetical protein